MFADTLSTKLHQCTRNTFSASTFKFVKTIFQKKSFTAEVQSVRWLLSIKLTRYDNQLLTRIVTKRDLWQTCAISVILLYSRVNHWRVDVSNNPLPWSSVNVHDYICRKGRNWPVFCLRIDLNQILQVLPALKSLFVCFSRGRSCSRHFSQNSMENTDSIQ